MEKPKIRVIGVGFPRTSTTSLQGALHILGYNPCHHMGSDVLATSLPFTRGRRWTAVFRTKDKIQRQAAIRAIFEDDGYKATVDFPPCIFADDLVEMYPDAKFILSLRKSPEAWRKSFTDVIDVFQQPWFTAATYPMPSFRFMTQPLLDEWEKLTQERYGCKLFGTKSTEVYHRHNEWVRKVVPRDRLLEFEASQGWEPLCQFLEVAVPEGQSYPHLNDSGWAKSFLSRIAMVGTLIWATWIAAFAVGAKFLYNRI